MEYRDTLQKDYATTGWSLVCSDAPKNLEQHWRPMNLFEIIFPSNIRNLCKRMHRFQEITNLGFLIERPTKIHAWEPWALTIDNQKLDNNSDGRRIFFWKNSGHGPSAALAMAIF